MLADCADYMGGGSSQLSIFPSSTLLAAAAFLRHTPRGSASTGWVVGIVIGIVIGLAVGFTGDRACLEKR